MSLLLPLAMQSQKQGEWCWAAVAASVGDYRKLQDPAGAKTQCEIVNAILKQLTCCTDGSTSACNQDALLDQALAWIGHLNEAPYAGTASFDSIRLITGPPYNLPIGVRVSNNATGHFLLIVGFVDDHGKQWIHTADPSYGAGTYDLQEFAASYQGAHWTHTYPIK